MPRFLTSTVRALALLLGAGMFLDLPLPAQGSAPNLTVAFDEANKLYEQGKLGASCDAYEQLIQGGLGTASVWFNLGNARFRNGEPGRAIAAFVNAQRLAPRDEGIRSNLEHVRKTLQGESHSAPGLWARFRNKLTANEWAVAAAISLGFFFLLLAAGEWRASIKPPVRRWVRLAGFATGLLALTAWQRSESERQDLAIVVVKEASIRFTPLEESPVSFSATDGFEMIVLNEKKSVSGQTEWLEVRDSARRMGWIRGDQIQLIRGI